MKRFPSFVGSLTITLITRCGLSGMVLASGRGG